MLNTGAADKYFQRQSSKPFSFQYHMQAFENLQMQIYASLFSILQLLYVETVAYSVKLGLLGPETPWAMLTIRNHIHTFNNGIVAKYEHSVVNEAITGLGTRGAGLHH